MISKYQEYYTSYKYTSNITAKQIVDVYSSRVHSSYVEYEVEDSDSYDSDMQSGARDIYYYKTDADSTKFFNVAHILFKFTDEQQAEYENIVANKENGRYSTEEAYNAALEELYLKVKPVVRKMDANGVYNEVSDRKTYEESAQSLRDYIAGRVSAGTTDYEKAQQSDLGSTLAKVYGGFGTQLNAYGFDLSVQLSYQLGGKVYDGTYEALMQTGDLMGQNFHKDVLKAWTPENPNSDIPRMNVSDVSSQRMSSRFLVSSDYLSLNNVTLGYTLPKQWIQKLGVSSLRLYVQGDNLAVFSCRKGFDPRQYFGLGSSTGSGNFTYSALRTITGGITLKF